MERDYRTRVFYDVNDEGGASEGDKERIYLFADKSKKK